MNRLKISAVSQLWALFHAVLLWVFTEKILILLLSGLGVLRII